MVNDSDNDSDCVEILLSKMGWDKFGFLFVCSFLHNVTVVVGDKFKR